MFNKFLKIGEANAEIGRLNAVVATLTTERDQARGELATANATIATRDTSISTLTTERDEARTALQNANAQAATVEEQAAAIASTVGTTKQVSADPNPSGDEKLTKFEQFQKLEKTDPKAASEFWKQHRAEILAGK